MSENALIAHIRSIKICWAEAYWNDTTFTKIECYATHSMELNWIKRFVLVCVHAHFAYACHQLHFDSECCVFFFKFNRHNHNQKPYLNRHWMQSRPTQWPERENKEENNLNGFERDSKSKDKILRAFWHSKAAYVIFVMSCYCRHTIFSHSMFILIIFSRVIISLELFTNLLEVQCLLRD